MEKQKIDCFQCEHFYVTWDPFHPKGCRALRFKSKESPCLVVSLSSGIECLQFLRKPPRKGAGREEEED